MKPYFPGWTVSPEWDRRERDQKRLKYRYSGANGAARSYHIRPDIIVHRVGLKENLLVVEAKRHENKDHVGDIRKLRGMTDLSGDYCYQVGVHLILNIRKQVVTGCDVYVNGAVDRDLTAWLRELLP